MEFRRNALRPLLIGTVVGVATACIFASGALESWSNLATDRLFLPRSADPSIVIVAIDDTSIGQIGRWPWDRKVHGDIITRLSEAGVRAIGYDVNFPEPSDAANDAALADAIRKAGNVVLPVELTVRQDRNRLVFDRDSVVSPISSLSGAAKATGHTNTPPDTDGVVRRIPLSVTAPDQTSLPSFASQVLKVALPDYDLTSVPTDRLSRLLINFDGPPKGTFPTISAVDLIRGTVQASFLKGKTVFVGSTAADLHDDQIVPTSAGAPMSGVELHASLYDTLLMRRWIRPVPIAFQMLLIVLLGVLLGLLIPFLRARFSTPLTFVLWVGVIVCAFLLFDRGWILDIVWPTLTLVFAYALVTLERRVTADRERRELRSAFSRYVSASVVSVILRDPKKLKLGGEKRRMTVLFSDVRGFTSIAETMPAEQLVDVMNAYLTRMTGIVFAHQGVLDKYIGDAVMAFWNAPLEQSDHALRAIKTAIAMQRALDEMNRAGAFPKNLALKIGIGINTGDMIVGNMGSEARFDYTVIGDNVNLASRMEGITKEYGVGILVSEATRREAGDSVMARRIDTVAVKGKKEPVVMYEILALAQEATEDQRALAADFERALDAYLAKDFRSAISTCMDILKKHPDDGPSKTLMVRAQAFLAEPPPDGWDGTWVYAFKK